MVSVIIPVYNVYDYMDKCLESVVNQTYRDLEILLINDGSMDGSDKKCEEWARKDARIRYISKENEGLGPTRNLGVSLAKGEYIMFVDSDDWVDAAIVEKLFNKLLETGSDIAVCDRYEVKLTDFSFNLITQETTEEVIEVDKTTSVINWISTSSWAKLYKKSLYTDNRIEQPSHYYEDVTTLVLLALSKRVCYVKEGLYYYVVDRGNSITNDITTLDHLVDYLITLVDVFQEYGLFEQYRDNILEMCKKRVSWNLYHASKVLNGKLAEICRKNMEFLNQYQEKGDLEFRKILFDLEKLFYSWGSYNLMIAMKMLMRMYTVQPPANHYAFSSLIGAMDTGGNLNEVDIYHKNDFRKNSLLREFKREFANKNVGEFSEVQYLVIDFLEERFDIGRYKERYFTLSDAFADREEGEALSFVRYHRGENTIERLWEESCLRFIALIRRYMKDKTVVLVRMKLAETYGNPEEQKKFDNWEEIRQINGRLEEKYDFFKENCPEALVVEVADSDLYYTDAHFKHGCYPWHLNHYMYLEIMNRIKETIWQKS